MATLPSYTKLTYVNNVTPPAISADNLNKNEIQIDALTTQVNKDQSNVTSEYVPSATYAVGNYSLYNGVLYRCTTAITTPETWNSAHWTVSKLADNVDTAIKTQATVNSNLAGNFASVYSPSSTYAVGAFCTYQNVLYKCTTAITTPEAWNSAHWMTSNLANYIDDSMTWKLVGTATGTNSITIPSNAKEIYILANVHNRFVTSTILISALSTTPIRVNMTGGYYNLTVGDTDYVMACVDVTNTTVNLSIAVRDNTNYLSSATIYVYYR